MKKYIKTTHESGRSMVEMLGVLAIIGVLSVGGIAGYSMAMTKFKITKTMDQVQMLTTNVRTLFASQRRYQTLSGQNAYQLGLFTDEICTGGSACTTANNPFGGTISIAAANTGGTSRSFTIEYTGLPQEACVKIATAEWGADASSGLISMTVGGTTYSWAANGAAWTAASNLPVDLLQASAKCAVAGTIKWEYR